jgi:hypothetical protein
MDSLMIFLKTNTIKSEMEPFKMNINGILRFFTTTPRKRIEKVI